MDETTELTQVLAAIDELSSPTNEEFMQALKWWSDTGVSLAAAKLAMEGGGGGGSLPAWWTVDSTPGSESVTFDGEIAATFNRAQRGLYSGAPVTIADDVDGGQYEYLTWDALGSGEALLDLTTPGSPFVVAGGIYSVTVVANARSVLTAGGIAEAVLHLDADGDDAICQMTFNAGNADSFATCSLNTTWYIPTNGVIRVQVYNFDGVSSRDFRLLEAMVQRIL